MHPVGIIYEYIDDFHFLGELRYFMGEKSVIKECSVGHDLSVASIRVMLYNFSTSYQRETSWLPKNHLKILKLARKYYQIIILETILFLDRRYGVV